MTSETIKKITDISSSEIDRLIIILKARDMLIEGDLPFLTASIIEYHYEELEELLRENGFTGGKLVPIFSSEEKCSWNYALFDSEYLSAEEVIKKIRNIRHS